MKVLVLCGDKWHPGSIVRQGLKALEAKGFCFDFIENARDELTPAMLERYAVIMNCKADYTSGTDESPWFQTQTPVRPEDFRAWVERGGGFLAVHGGTAFHVEDTSGYKEFLGCYFVQHPPQCDIQVKMTARHPVTAGIEDFILRDEHYQLAMLAQDAQILCTTHSATGGDQVGGYVRTMGQGRVCMLVPGHILSVWEHPEYQKMLMNALRWCAKEV